MAITSVTTPWCKYILEIVFLDDPEFALVKHECVLSNQSQSLVHAQAKRGDVLGQNSPSWNYIGMGYHKYNWESKSFKEEGEG